MKNYGIIGKWYVIYTPAISASENGLGVFMWVQCERGRNLGKKIEFASLNKELQKKVELAIH